MKADIKAQWVKDLRSGNYLQGSGSLRRDNGEGQQDKYCCLGVLCEQAVRAGVIPAPELHNGGYYRYLDDEFDGAKVTGEAFSQECSLPRKVAEWAGLPYRNGRPVDDVIVLPNEDDFDVSAIMANDSLKLSFTQIADLIEQNVPAE